MVTIIIIVIIIIIIVTIIIMITVTRIVEAEEEVDVTEVTGDFFTSDSGVKIDGADQVPGPNLQAVTEALFDNCEDYQNIQNMKNVPIWRPY